MRGTLQVIPIEKTNEKLFLNFLNRDMILHVFTIYDLKHMRDKTRVWVALKDAEICGYMLEFDERIVHTHGTVESVTKLLHCIDLDELIFIIEPHHLTVVKEFFKPVEPTDPSSKSQVTTYLVMKANADAFKPLIRHQVKSWKSKILMGFRNILEKNGKNALITQFEEELPLGHMKRMR